MAAATAFWYSEPSGPGEMLGALVDYDAGRRGPGVRATHDRVRSQFIRGPGLEQNRDVDREWRSARPERLGKRRERDHGSDAVGLPGRRGPGECQHGITAERVTDERDAAWVDQPGVVGIGLQRGPQLLESSRRCCQFAGFIR